MPISTIQSGSFPSNVAIDTDTLVVDGANNRVGVGTANPQNKVHIVAGSSGSSTFDSRYNLTIEDDGENYIGIYSPNNSYGGVRFVNADNSIRGNIDYYHGTNGDKMLFYAQNECQFSYPGVGVKLAITPNGITFNGDTAAANALDDYEEGEWTPSAIVTYSSPTLSNISSTGLYVKIGKVVYCWFKCRFSTNGAGNIGMSGLPFAGSGGYNVGSCRENSSTGNMYILEGLSSTSINVFRRYDNNGCYNGTNEMNGAFMYETT